MAGKIRSKNGIAAGFTFLTSHAFVLIHIARNPRTTLREIARKTKLTEGTVNRIVGDLEKAGYIAKHRDGRRNSYSMNEDVLLSHRFFGSLTVAELADALGNLKTPQQQ
jgi:DNA-binding IclR family transcriptional regulator